MLAGCGSEEASESPPLQAHHEWQRQRQDIMVSRPIKRKAATQPEPLDLLAQPATAGELGKPRGRGDRWKHWHHLSAACMRAARPAQGLRHQMALRCMLELLAAGVNGVAWPGPLMQLFNSHALRFLEAAPRKGEYALRIWPLAPVTT